MGKIFASSSAMYASFCEEIIRLSGKKRPRTLLIPTARDDDEKTIEAGCVRFKNTRIVESLCLVRDRPLQEEIKKKILNADIIYVDGGNTVKMMRVWRKLGVDRFLKEAYDKGIVLAGPSAGANCWFNYGREGNAAFADTVNKMDAFLVSLGYLDGGPTPMHHK